MRPALLAAILVFIFVASLITPIYANDESLTHTISYSADGIIDLKKQAGHLCNTGAEMKQTITGEGALSKDMAIIIIEGRIEVEDGNQFVTAVDTINNLKVISAIELCTPHKTGYDYDRIRRQVFSYRWESEPWLEDETWIEYWEETYEDNYEFIGEGNPLDINPAWEGHFIESSWSLSPEIIALTNQIWASSISAEPGHKGILNSEFAAAYGPPMEGWYNDNTQRFSPQRISSKDQDDSDKWAYDPKVSRSMSIGPNYIGDYFTIDQYVYTSQGEMKRYIDISSPYSHALLHEDMVVTGTSEVNESFTINNVPPGEDVESDWWSLFGTETDTFGTATAKDRNLEHDASYAVSGYIDFKKQAGHFCNTGAEMKQTISGDGELAKAMKVDMIEGLLAVQDTNEFTTALDADEDMNVTSVIELCAPPKQILKGDAVWLHHFGTTSPHAGYSRNSPYGGGASYGRSEDSLIYGPYTDGAVVNPLLHPNGVNQPWWIDEDYVTDVSDQIWAASVSANPGHKGLLDMSFEAAHGPHGGHFPSPDGIFSGTDDWWGTYELVAPPDSWWTSTDGKGIFPVVGSDYVGNYFHIDQTAKTSDGKLKRYIDISSPWTHGYLHEDMSVIGTAEIKDAFEMSNLPASSEDGGRWWDLADTRTYTPIYDYYLPGFFVENYSGHTTGSVDDLIDYWLWDILDYYDREDLHSELYDLYSDGEWQQALQRMEEKIEDFNSSDAPDPDNLIHLPPFIIFDFPWPVWLWWDLF